MKYSSTVPLDMVEFFGHTFSVLANNIQDKLNKISPTNPQGKDRELFIEQLEYSVEYEMIWKIDQDNVRKLVQEPKLLVLKYGRFRSSRAMNPGEKETWGRIQTKDKT